MLLHVAHLTFFFKTFPKDCHEKIHNVEINCRNLCGFLQYALTFTLCKWKNSDFMPLEVVAGLIWFAGRGSLTETFNSLCRDIVRQKWSFTERKVCPPSSVPLPPPSGDWDGRVRNGEWSEVEEDMNKRRRWETREREEQRGFYVSHRSAVTGFSVTWDSHVSPIPENKETCYTFTTNDLHPETVIDSLSKCFCTQSPNPPSVWC